MSSASGSKELTIVRGEILLPEDDIRVWVARDPVSVDRDCVHVPCGATIREALEAALLELKSVRKAKRYQVWLTDNISYFEPIPKAWWDHVRPKPGYHLVCRPKVAEFVTAIFAIVAAAVKGLGALLGGLGFFGKLISGAIAMGIKFLINQLFAPKKDETRQLEPVVSYNIQASRNQMLQYEAVPLILGKHRYAPPIAAPFYTETVGNDQYVHGLYTPGYGYLDVTEPQIGETSIYTFTGVTYESRPGHPSDTALTVYPTETTEEALAAELNGAGWVERTTATGVVGLGVDFVWPNGLAWFDGKGAIQPMGVNLRWQYAPTGTGAWVEGPPLNFVLATRDTFRAGQFVWVAEDQYDVRVQKINADLDISTVLETVNWQALRGLRTGEPIEFPDPVSVQGIRIKGTGQLNGVIDTFNALYYRHIAYWNGSIWTTGASNNPGGLIPHVLQGVFNKKPASSDAIDWEAFEGFSEYCTTEGWAYNRVITTAVSVEELCQEIAVAGRGSKIMKDGKHSVVWDQQDRPIVQLFTPRNSHSFEGTHKYSRTPHAFRVQFVNELKGYQQDERIVYDDGYTAANATEYELLELKGVTHPDLIYRHARYHLAQRRLRPAIYSLKCDFEGMLLNRNDRIRVQHDAMLVGLGSFRVKETYTDGDGVQHVVVDDALILEASKGYCVRFRSANDGFLFRSLVAGQVGELWDIELTSTGTLPGDGDLGTWGETDSSDAVFVVYGIEVEEDLQYRVVFVDEATGIYEADSGAIPPFESHITTPFDTFQFPPTDLIVSTSAYQEGSEAFEQIHLQWKLPRLGATSATEIEYILTSEGFYRPYGTVPPSQTILDIRRLQSGNYKVRIRALFTDGTFSQWLESPVIVATTLKQAPADVTGFGVNTHGATSTLTWDPVAGVAVTYQIRFAAPGAVPTWNAAILLFDNIGTNSIQAPSLVGTYLIKAQKPGGIQSINPAVIASSILEVQGINVVEILTENPTFDGTRAGVSRSGDTLRLTGRNVMHNWESLSDIINMHEGDGDADSIGYFTEGYYYFDQSIDLGAVYTSRLAATIEATGFAPGEAIAYWPVLASLAAMDTTSPSDWSVTLEYRSTLDDPVADDWSGWQVFTISDISARAFEFRAVLRGKLGADPGDPYAVTTPVVTKLEVEVDMDDRVVAANDIPVTVAGLTILFEPPFKEFRGLGRNDQGLATGDYAVVTGPGGVGKPDETGFHIIYRNAAAAPVARSLDYVAKGFGQEAT